MKQQWLSDSLCVFWIGLMISLVSGRVGDAEDWPGFRGLDLSAARPDGSIPLASLSANNPTWSVDLGTTDAGSVAIQDGHAFLLSASKDRQSIRLICLEQATGNEDWSRSFPNADNHLHSRNTLASGTPATDGEYVIIAHSDRTHTFVRCLTHGGEEVWSRDFGTAQSQHGFGTSPTIHGDTVLFNFSQQAERLRSGSPGQSRIIAMDRATGDVKWETPLTSTRVCYSVPVVKDGMVICTNTGDGVFALSLETGEKLWNASVFSMRCVSTPVIADDLIIGSSGSGGGGNHLVAVRMPLEPTSKPVEAFRLDRSAPYVPTGVMGGDKLFVVDDKGIASALSLSDGRVLWNKRLGGNFSASPVLVGDLLIFVSMQGELTVVRAGDQFDEVASVDLAGSVSATPAYADGQLFIRVGSELRCY
ncbi:MAG: PQQ-binding-like beta-propeller repeat protein [Planctomycetota bacterium]